MSTNLSESTFIKGIKTSEFYLSTVVAIIGGVVQFLPSNVASEAVKIAGIIAAVLSTLGYTASRTSIKNNANNNTSN